MDANKKYIVQAQVTNQFKQEPTDSNWYLHEGPNEDGLPKVKREYGTAQTFPTYAEALFACEELRRLTVEYMNKKKGITFTNPRFSVIDLDTLISDVQSAIRSESDGSQ